MKKVLLLSTLLFPLIACVNVGGNKIPTPPNLTSDTKEINKIGEVTIKVINTGGQPITVHNVYLQNQMTTTEIEDEIQQGELFCNEKVLSPKEYCNIKVMIPDHEAGIMTLKANSTLGTYPIDIKVNTADNNLLTLDNPEIATTKEVSRKVINLTNSPLQINALYLEKDNKTLKITENHCNTIESHQSCEIKVKATNNVHSKHKLFARTNNVLLVTSSTNIFEKTDEMKMGLLKNEESHVVNQVVVESPVVYNYAVKNDGGREIHINNIVIDNNMGQIINNDCNNKTLLNNDNCNVALSVNSNAVGNSMLKAITQESSEIIIANIKSNAAITINNMDSVDVHVLGDNKVNIVNNTNFDFEIDKIVTNSTVKVDYQSYHHCEKITAHSSCIIDVYGADKEMLSTISIYAKNSNYVKDITVNTQDKGINVTYQGLDTNFYNKIPKNNGYLYAAFLVNNTTNKDIRLNSGNTIFKIKDAPNDYYITRPCEFNDDHEVIVHPGSCELIEEVYNNYDFYKFPYRIFFLAYQDSERLHLPKMEFVGRLIHKENQLNKNINATQSWIPNLYNGHDFQIIITKNQYPMLGYIKQTSFRLKTSAQLGAINQGDDNIYIEYQDIISEIFQTIDQFSTFGYRLISSGPIKTKVIASINQLLYNAYNNGHVRIETNLNDITNENITLNINCDNIKCHLNITNPDLVIHPINSNNLYNTVDQLDYSLPNYMDKVDVVSGIYFN